MSTWPRWWRTRAHSPPSPAAVCCRWSKLTATVWAPSQSPARSSRSSPWGFGVASVEEGAALRAAGITRPILVVSPLLPRWIRTLHPSIDLRPTDRRPGRARGLGGSRRAGPSTSRSIPGWPGRGSLERRAGIGALAEHAENGARLGRGVHPLSRFADPIRRATALQWRRFQADAGNAAAPSLAGSCRQQRRRPSGPLATRPTWSGRASSCTAEAPAAQRPAAGRRTARPGGGAFAARSRETP